MPKEIKTYLRCVCANKATLIGFSLMLIGVLTLLFLIFVLLTGSGMTSSHIVQLFILCGGELLGGFLLAGVTDFGRDTYVAYRRVSEHIREFGEVERYANCYRNYCSTCGVKLGTKDYQVYLKN